MRCFMLFAVIVFLGCETETANENEPSSNGEVAQRLTVVDPDLEKVRKWLRENLPSGEWEELRWWPARPVASEGLPSELTVEEVKRLIEKGKLQIAELTEKLQKTPNEAGELKRPNGERPKMITIDTGESDVGESTIDPRRMELIAIIAEHEHQVSQMESRLEQLLQMPKPESPKPEKHRRAARLKYRTANKFGALEVFDDVFIIHEDSVELVRFVDGPAYRVYPYRVFPE